MVSARAARPAKRSGGETALRVLATIWLSVSVLNLVIWGLVCVTTGQLVYPWWVWVTTPSGAVLGTIWWMVRGRPSDNG